MGFYTKGKTLILEDRNGDKLYYNLDADSSLTMSGVPADAKVTGDRLTALEKYGVPVTEIEHAIENYFINNPVGSSNGYNIAFLGCPDAQCSETDKGYGNCTVIYDNEHCVIVDLGNQSNANKLLAFLAAKGISSIDAVIITHHEPEHAKQSAVSAILNSTIDTSSCVWYLPHAGIDWSSFVGGSEYQSAANSTAALLNDIVYPTTEGQTVNFGNFSISFYNVSSALYSTYYSYRYDANMNSTTNTNYNNFSMVCVVRGQGANTVLTSDIERPAEDNLAYVIAQGDILQIPHHGLNTKPNEKAVAAVRADYSILTSYGLQKERAFSAAGRPYVQKGRQAGTVLSTYNGNSIEFFISLHHITVKVGSNDIASGSTVGQMIIEQEDLNNYVVSGEYYIRNATVAKTISNMPKIKGVAIGGGNLFVTGSNSAANGIIQLFIPTFTNKRYICIRVNNDNGWSEWEILDFTITQTFEYNRSVANAIGQSNLVTLPSSTVSQNGISFTYNPTKKSVTIIGTATASFYQSISSINLIGGNTYYIGGCPPDGSSSSYRLYFGGVSSSGTVDFGMGAKYTPAADEPRQLRFYISKGDVLDTTIYPVVFENTQGGIGSGSIQQAVDNYLDNHPIDVPTPSVDPQDVSAAVKDYFDENPVVIPDIQDSIDNYLNTYPVISEGIADYFTVNPLPNIYVTSMNLTETTTQTFVDPGNQDNTVTHTWYWKYREWSNGRVDIWAIGQVRTFNASQWKARTIKQTINGVENVPVTVGYYSNLEGEKNKPFQISCPKKFNITKENQRVIIGNANRQATVINTTLTDPVLDNNGNVETAATIGFRLLVPSYTTQNPYEVYLYMECGVKDV